MLKEPYAWVADFEKALVRQILADPIVLPKIYAHLRPERIPTPAVKNIVTAALKYYKQYDRAPTAPELMQGLKAEIEAGALTNSVLVDTGAILDEIEGMTQPDSAFIIDTVGHEARREALYEVLDAGWTLWKAGKYDEFADSVAKAALVGRTDSDKGLDYGKSVATRAAARRDDVLPPRYATGIPDLDERLAGGLQAGELGVVLGAPGFGKSMFLLHVAYHTVLTGGAVVYYTLEMSESSVADRLDAAMAAIPIAGLKARAEDVATRVAKRLEQSKGSIFIKFMQPGSTCRDIKAHLQTLRVEAGFVPSLIVVDYGDIVTGGGRYEGRYEELGSVYTDLRGIAVTHQVPLWTASQANRDALTKKVVTNVDIAESFKKVQVADVIVAICRTDDEKIDKKIRFYLSKCRYAADAAIVGPLTSAYERGLIVDPNAHLVDE